MAKKNWMTAAEHKALLLADPEWVARNAAREAEFAERTARLRAEQATLIADILDAGFIIKSVWDFVNTAMPYPAAIPVLLEHMKRPYHTRIREGIIRALGTPEARGLGGKPLLAELWQEKDGNMRWVIANALAVAADASDKDELQRVFDNPAFADVNERLGAGLKRLKRQAKKPKAKRMLLD